MAESPAHKFGQMIGEFLESEVLLPELEEFCRNHGLYLDHQKRNRPIRPGQKVSWADQYGNTHDLDFVIEREGTDHQIGMPVGFIESAWRRYSKHSRNKAQEIQGAILPLAEKYRCNNPFLGTVLAGVFTEGSLDQLRSIGFHVLYFPYDSIVEAFQSEGIDVTFDEHTSDQVFTKKAKQIKNASPGIMTKIRNYLVKANQTNINSFFAALNRRLGRYITRVIVIPLYGRVSEFGTIEAAICFLDHYIICEGSVEFRKYEIRVDFSNGDKIEASIEDKDKVKEFLHFVARQ